MKEFKDWLLGWYVTATVALIALSYFNHLHLTCNNTGCIGILN